MPNESPEIDVIGHLFQFVGEAYMQIGFIEARGAGAFLFTLIAVAFIRSGAFSKMKLSSIVKAWRKREKLQPPPAE